MPYFIIGVALLISSLLILRWYVNAPPSTLLRIFKWMAIGIAVFTALFFLIAGPKSWALWSIPVLLPWLMRARTAMRMAKNWSRMASNNRGSEAGSEQMSEVETGYFKMHLDHQTGEMNGEITKGKFVGQTLRNLSLDDLLILLNEAREDKQSVQVLRAYLDRYHGSEWQKHAGTQNESGNDNMSMTEEQAYEVLGLRAGASNEEIRKAHHRLMNKIHPDHGGSNFLATQINQAKDLLLGR